METTGDVPSPTQCHFLKQLYQPTDSSVQLITENYPSNGQNDKKIEEREKTEWCGGVKVGCKNGQWKVVCKGKVNKIASKKWLLFLMKMLWSWYKRWKFQLTSSTWHTGGTTRIKTNELTLLWSMNCCSKMLNPVNS